MNKQFTASEVRSAIGALEARDMEYEAEMLQAYADRLEADEQAVPSAWMVSDDGWNQCFTTLEQCQMYGKKLIPLYTPRHSRRGDVGGSVVDRAGIYPRCKAIRPQQVR